MLEYLIKNQNSTSDKKDKIYYLVEEKFNNSETESFIVDFLKILYRVGILGIRLQSSSTPAKWSFIGYKPMSSDLGLNSQILVHPAFYNVLDISLSN